MVNITQFLIGLAIAIIVAAILAILTGIIYNGKGHVSVIEKKKKFHTIEIRRFSYYFPIVYRKVRYYPTIDGKKKINDKIIHYQVVDVMKAYKSNKKIKDILKENLEDTKALETNFGIKIL